MGWFVRERRGIGWRDQTLDSISPPPLPLLVFFGLLIMLMFLASYSHYKAELEKSKMNLKLLFFLLPLLVILMLNFMVDNRWRFYTGISSPAYETVRDEGSAPWGLLLMLVFLLIMVQYQSSFQLSWFRAF
ncbi:uncharacterized protein LOC111385688 [Olea europaea var. sylvestris]|uniref:uncharacterized protein LOC111385688 n=1 Tax=Olea europaea var. sylvestris TaxID=158386 RepID=UPI000C1CD8BD|nr:uncharacterized protein LOC111385688 [Olea europaea var. sylvestris]